MLMFLVAPFIGPQHPFDILCVSIILRIKFKFNTYITRFESMSVTAQWKNLLDNYCIAERLPTFPFFLLFI